MWPLIKHEIRERKVSLTIYVVVALLLTWLYIILFPTVRDQAASLNKLVETYPDALKKAFKIEGAGFETIESFLSYELFSLMWPLLVIMLGLSRAGNAIAGEIERNTIGTLLAQPISRTRLFMSKYLSGALSIGLFICASILAPIPIGWIYKLNIHPRNFLLCAVFCALFSLAVFSTGMMVSSIMKDRSKVYGIVGGTLFLMYVLNVVSGIKPSLEGLKYASVFHYFDAVTVLSNAHLPLVSCIVFVLITVISTIGGIFFFNSRDISI